MNFKRIPTAMGGRLHPLLLSSSILPKTWIPISASLSSTVTRSALVGFCFHYPPLEKVDSHGDVIKTPPQTHLNTHTTPSPPPSPLSPTPAGGCSRARRPRRIAAQGRSNGYSPSSVTVVCGRFRACAPPACPCVERCVPWSSVPARRRGPISGRGAGRRGLVPPARLPA